MVHIVTSKYGMKIVVLEIVHEILSQYAFSSYQNHGIKKIHQSWQPGLALSALALHSHPPGTGRVSV